jgi:hypothetical protein
MATTLSTRLRDYDRKYALHPVAQIRAMAAYAAPEVERVRAREAYLRRPQNPQVFETPLRLPSKAEISASATVMSRGESLASLGPRLKQIGFLANMGLYPPDDELDLDAWVASRLRELKFRGPSTLANWMKIGPTAREAALNNETQMIAAEQQRRDNDAAYQLENEESKNDLLAIMPLPAEDQPITEKLRKRKAAKELEGKLTFKTEPEVEELRTSKRPASLAARLQILEQANEGRRKPMSLPVFQKASKVEEADERTIPPPPPLPNSNILLLRELPSPFDDEVI